MQLQESGEMYLETIYILSRELPVVRSLDVAEYMNFSKPSITRAMKLLKTAGLVESNDKGHLTLTKEGKKLAMKTYERHVFLTKLFCDIGVPEDIAVKDACKLEHYISEETFKAIKKYAKKISELKKSE